MFISYYFLKCPFVATLFREGNVVCPEKLPTSFFLGTKTVDGLEKVIFPPESCKAIVNRRPRQMMSALT
jgi:hypothetical protein